MAITGDTETDGNDAWREKTWGYYHEGREWKEFHEAASDPATLGDELEKIVNRIVRLGLVQPNGPPHGSLNVLTGVASVRRMHNPFLRAISGSGSCIFELVAAHINTPPSALAEIIYHDPTAAPAFCRNPIAPLVLLEMPDFLIRLSYEGKLALLSAENLPTVYLPLIETAAENIHIKEGARQHVAIAGELGPGASWEAEVRLYFQEDCKIAEGAERQWHFDLAEIGLAPEWAKEGGPAEQPLQPPDYPLLDEWFRYEHAIGSPKEAALLGQIGPDVKDEEVLARGLRAQATPADLIALATLREGEVKRNDVVMQAIYRHPKTDAQVLEVLESIYQSVPLQLLAQHEQAGPGLLQNLLSNEDPLVRRLARSHRNAPLGMIESSRLAFAKLVDRDMDRREIEIVYWDFVSFVASLHFGHSWDTRWIVKKAESPLWTDRLEAVLIAAQNPDALNYDWAGRTREDLLNHLAHDGNRIVRAAAKTCLANPDYRFVL